ncbi:MAG: translocation/assembly module TamB domain-containing protein, partial [Bacteroidales bacterium]|nr:translocation/assembly module TamB domain-containing protein [Bacteroidales bacterium]
GNVSGESLAVGRFLKDTTFGNLSFNGAVAAQLGKTPVVDVNGLHVSEFDYNGYKYSQITADGRLEGRDVTLRLTDDDPNLTLNLTADATIGDKKSPTFVNAYIDLAQADLHALNFDSRDTCVVSGRIKADGQLTPNKLVIGDAAIKGLTARLEGGTQNIGDIILNSYSDDLYNITLKSQIANASYRGASSISELVSGIKAYLAKDLGNIIKASPKGEGTPANGAFYLRTGNLKPLAAFLMPGLHISEGTTLKAELDGTDAISMHASSPLIAIGSNYIKNFVLDASGDTGPLDASITADILQSGNIILRNNKIGITASDNKVILGLRFDNKETENRKGNFNAVVEFPEQTPDSYKLVASLLNSDLTLEDSNWNISPSRISYKDKKIAIENFKLSSGDQQYLLADGVVSDIPGSEVNLKLNEFDISIINRLLNMPLEVGGLVTGKANGKEVLGKTPELTTDLICKSLLLNKEEMGNIFLRSSWDDPSQSIKVSIENTFEESFPLKATGYYKPSKKYLSLNAAIDRFKVGWLDPMLEGIARQTGGSVSGLVTAEGPLDKLVISSEGTRFNDFAATIDFTNVPYVINGPFTISNKGVSFQNDTIADRYGHVGRISGGVTYDLFKDIKLNVLIDKLKDMHVLNTDAASASSGMYGKAFGSGRITLTGPISNILLGLNLRTGDGGIHFPISSSGSTRTSILTFVDNSVPVLDEYDSLLISKRAVSDEKKTASNLKVNAKLNITNATEVAVDVNRSFGDMLKAHGNGNIEVNFSKDLLDIKGGYNVEEGSYKFALMGITSKDFIIEPGGTVSFNGDIMQSDLDLKATYRTKASIGTLIADSTSVNTRRTVNCGIDIKGKLSNPQISFDIDIPDLDPSTQALVQAALSTEEKQLKQFLALLLSGSFVPDEQSGIVNNTTLLFSNASEIMANQVNTIFRQLDIPLDLGFNYQPGLGGVDIFDVAISTQLFNNRVTINGSIGNQNYLTSYNSSDIVGNVDMEIKLNKNGMLRLNIFSHAADRFSNYLDQTQRNGAGIVYQQDFDTFREFLRKLLRKKDLPDMVQPSATIPPPLSVQ